MIALTMTPRMLVASCLLALPWTAPGAAQTPIGPGATYPGGTALTSPLTGIALTVPDGFQAGWDPELEALLVAQEGGRVRAAVWGWSEGTMEEAAAAASERLEAVGIQGQQRAAPETSDTEVRAWYDVMTPQGQGLLLAVFRMGEAGNVVAFAALGAPDAQEAVEGIIGGILSSVALTAPGAARWRAEVEGAVLTTGSSSSDYSPGGAGGSGSAASRSAATLQLCRGMGYAFETESETYVSIPGASASNTSRDAHQGAWYLVADLVGTPTLVLEADDGRLFHWSVAEQGNDLVVDGTAYGVAGSC